MINVEDSAISCGVGQIYDLDKSTPHAQVIDIADIYFEECGDWCTEHVCKHRHFGTNFGHFIFSDIVKNRTGNGSRLAAFLRKIDVGTVVESPITVNPNSGNRIRVWIFTPHRMNLFNWVRANQDKKKVRPKRK